MVQNAEQVGARSGIKTILLVEDDVNIGEVLVQAITQETTFLAILVSNGFEALSVIKEVKPDLFILDYQLPRMNGIELYDHLHAIDKLADVPAVIMSARLPQQVLGDRNILAMSKPVDLDDFLQAIEDLLA
jgi:CheY-like chemotaxis protein